MAFSSFYLLYLRACGIRFYLFFIFNNYGLFFSILSYLAPSILGMCYIIIRFIIIITIIIDIYCCRYLNNKHFHNKLINENSKTCYLLLF